jgi:hypothetical protein
MRRCVKAFADERRGADDQQSVAGFGCVQSLDNRPPVGGAHRYLEHERLTSPCGKHCGESFDVGDPSGEDQTVAATVRDILKATVHTSAMLP